MRPMIRRINLALFAMFFMLPACSKTELRACHPPRSYWQKPHNFDGLAPPMNELSLTRDGLIYWNGVRISSRKLKQYLEVVHGLHPEPIVFLQAEMGGSCSALEAVRDQVDKALECKKPYSKCAEGIKSVWRKLPTPPGSPIS